MVLTNFDGVLAHPDEGLHRLPGWVCILLAVAAGICRILLGDSIVAMPKGLLNQICCLSHYRHCVDIGGLS